MPGRARKMTATIFPEAREGPSPPVRKIPERSEGEPAAGRSRLQAKISRANWKMPASMQAANRLRAESRKRIAPGGEKPEAAQGSLCRAFVLRRWAEPELFESGTAGGTSNELHKGFRLCIVDGAFEQNCALLDCRIETGRNIPALAA